MLGVWRSGVAAFCGPGSASIRSLGTRWGHASSTSSEFAWDDGLVHLSYSHSPWSNFQDWASAQISEQGATGPFEYRTGFFE